MTDQKKPIERKLITSWLAIFFVVLLWSGIRPHDYFTWMLEVSPAVLGLMILASTYKRFQFTKLTYWLMLVHAIILIIGGHYTYAKVPLFNWIKDAFDLSRNHYDKVGHFAQGFVPAIIAREVLIRKSPVTHGKWLFFIVVCICLAFSAFYEFIEWWVAVATGTAAEAFLGTQGYVWDTQSDMFLALIGAIIALVFLGKYHDKALGPIINHHKHKYNHYKENV
jgi:putative membrane protein